MKKIVISNFIGLTILSVFCFSQKIASPYEVGTWQGFRTSAISYTFDDNCPNQLAVAVPMFNEYGFKLTLFTVTATTNWSWYANWSGLQEASDQGHEIGCHTINHPHFNGLLYDTQVSELVESKDTIESRIKGEKCLTVAYPFCETGYDTLVKRYYLAARICSGSIESKSPSNFMRLSSNICGTEGIKTVAALNAKADAAASLKGWLIYLIHGINGDGGWSDLNSDTLRGSLEHLNANPDKFWVTSFGNAAKYIRERNADSVAEISANDDSLSIIVTDTLDNSIYNQPITIRRPLPAGWSSAYVIQNDDTVHSSVVEVNGSSYIMFDVLPDNGTITIIKNGVTAIGSRNTLMSPSLTELFQNYPNPFNPSTTISYFLPKDQHVEIKIFDLLGSEVETLVNTVQSIGMHSVKFTGKHLSSGIYFYRLRVESNTQIKKFVLLQ